MSKERSGGLTRREVQVLTLLTQGNTTKLIADCLGTSASTVEKQIRSARKKLLATNNEQAVVNAIRLSIIMI